MIEHRHNTDPSHSPIMQKKHIMEKESNEILKKEVKHLVAAGVMRAMQKPKWIANPILIKKGNGTMRIDVDFTDLNKAC